MHIPMTPHVAVLVPNWTCGPPCLLQHQLMTHTAHRAEKSVATRVYRETYDLIVIGLCQSSVTRGCFHFYSILTRFGSGAHVWEEVRYMSSAKICKIVFGQYWGRVSAACTQMTASLGQHILCLTIAVISPRRSGQFCESALAIAICCNRWPPIRSACAQIRCSYAVAPIRYTRHELVVAQRFWALIVSCGPLCCSRVRLET
jgi:hypothetical protein